MSTPSEYHTTHDIPYTEFGISKQSLDIYTPASPTNQKLPVLFFIHGGGWKRGDKKWANNYIFGELYGNIGKAFAAKQFVSVVISYRIGSISTVLKALSATVVACIATTVASWFSQSSLPLEFQHKLIATDTFLILFVFIAVFAFWIRHMSEGSVYVRHPDHISDVTAAFQWVRQNISTYNGDPTHIIIMGHSAGAHLGALLTLDEQYLRDGGIESIKGFVGVSGVYNFGRLAKTGQHSRFFYVNPVFGGTPQRDQLFQISPLTYSRRLPFPVLLLNASFDMHLTKDAHELRDSLLSHENDVEWKAIPDTNHFTVVSRVGSRKDQTSGVVLAWLQEKGLAPLIPKPI